MKISIKYLVFTIIIFLWSACNHYQPKVLIIGDSISMGYTPFLKKEFKNKARISRIPGNGQHTKTGLNKLDRWLGQNEWDIIQFNWGLWDLYYYKTDSFGKQLLDTLNGTITHSSIEYAENLEMLVNQLKTKTNAKLIFITTTYVPNKNPGIQEKDVILFNERAKEIMTQHQIQIIDLYEPSKSIHKNFGVHENDIHYTKEGYKKLSLEIEPVLAFEIKKIQAKQ